MAQHKVKFTVWLAPDILRAAKAKATLDGTTASEVLAAAAKAMLIDSDKEHTDAQLLAAVERVFNLIQRIDRRRGYDQQVLKEMVGLLVQSFFNHTPAIPDKDKKAALHSGKARFNRFLDALAANLRGSRSILNDLPSQTEPVTDNQAVLEDASVNATPRATADRSPTIAHPTSSEVANHHTRTKSALAEPPQKWSLF